MTKQKPTLNQADIELLSKNFATKKDFKLLDKRFEQLEVKYDKQFKKLNDRFDQLESNIAESLAIPVQNHETRLHRIESTLDLPPITP